MSKEHIQQIAEAMWNGSVTIHYDGAAWQLSDDDRAEVIKALDKQIPVNKHRYMGYRCSCGEEVAKKQSYCEYCGQHLADWSGK